MAADAARPRSKFAGGDQTYLRDVQYVDAANLTARWSLHSRYSTAATPWMTWVHSHLGLERGNAVLDAGCGPGYLWADPAATVPAGVQLTLADLSPGMVAAAVERTKATARFAGVAGREADLQRLPFDDGQFDRVVALHMLYHLPDPEVGVAELARVVRSGGRTVVATSGRRHLRELWAVYHEVFDYSPLDDIVDVFGIENGFPILREQYARVAWFAYDDTLVCTDPDDVVAYLLSGVPGPATDEERGSLRVAVERRFDAGGGSFVVQKDTGCFVCEGPRSPIE